MRRRSRIVAIAGLFLLAHAYAAEDADGVASCSSAERESYLELLRQAVAANWSMRDRAQAKSCTIVVTQNFRGEVLDVRLEDCPDDPLVRKSATDAAYDASPLPTPANRTCRERVVRLRLTRREQATD